VKRNSIRTRLRLWRVRRAQRRVHADLELLNAQMIASHVDRAARRRIFRDLVKVTRNFAELADLERVHEEVPR